MNKPLKKLFYLDIFLTILWSTLIYLCVRRIGGGGDIYNKISPFIVCLSCIGIYSAIGTKTKISAVPAFFLMTTIAIVSSILLIFYLYFKAGKTSFSIAACYAILQSDFAESISFMETFLLVFKKTKNIIFVILFFILTVFTFIYHRKLIKKINITKKTKLLVLCFSTILFILSFYYLKPVQTVVTTYKTYYRDLEEFNKIHASVETPNAIKAIKTQQGELYVIVIGESESKDYMDAYTGPAENTPWMSNLSGKDGWVKLNHAYSNHTHTAQTLSAALTDGRYLTGLTFPYGPNIISLSKTAEINTIWLSNQANLGATENPIAAFGKSTNHSIFINKNGGYDLGKTIKPDEVLLSALKQTLDNLDLSKNNLLVVHLMGNHFPYQDRYPKNFYFTDYTSKKYVGNIIDELPQRKNANLYQEYITSIKYTDSILHSIYELIKDKTAETPSVFIYFSDHGEDIFEPFGSHNIDHFNWGMARIPFIVGLSDAYRKKYPNKFNQLENNKNQIFTNDLIFDLYLGLANIETEAYKPEFDISQPNYSITLDNAKNANGYIKNDPYLQIFLNMTEQNQLNKKFAAHRTNTLFKLKQAQKFNIKSFELDLYYEKDKQGQIILSVGHDTEIMASLTLEEYLENINPDFEFIWFDIKNIDNKNAKDILLILNQLDKQYNIKQRALIESRTPEELPIFIHAGWQTSYYLDWESLLNNAQHQNLDSLKLQTEEIANIIKKHNITGISYDIAADEVVIKHLIPTLPKDTKLYSWTFNDAYTDHDLPKKSKKYKHLEHLLIQLPSKFTI